MVEPKSEQMVDVPAGAAPLSVETGTSTAGVRTPPITLPYWSSASAAGFWLERRNGSGDGGGVPCTTQRTKSAKAACATTCCGPLLMALEQCRTLEAGPNRYESAWRCAGHLPGADVLGVRLLRRRVAELYQVGLGLEHEDRHAEIGPDAYVRRPRVSR